MIINPPLKTITLVVTVVLITTPSITFARQIADMTYDHEGEIRLGLNGNEATYDNRGELIRLGLTGSGTVFERFSRPDVEYKYELKSLLFPEKVISAY